MRRSTRRRELQQLGVVGGSGQLCAATAAAGWSARGPGDAGARICRPVAAGEEQSVRSVESENFDPGEEPGGDAAGAKGSGAGGRNASGAASSRQRTTTTRESDGKAAVHGLTRAPVFKPVHGVSLCWIMIARMEASRLEARSCTSASLPLQLGDGVVWCRSRKAFTQEIGQWPLWPVWILAH